MSIINVAVDIPGITPPRIIDMPDTPPVVKWFGNLKKYTPAAINNTPALIMAKDFRLLTLKKFLTAFINVPGATPSPYFNCMLHLFYYPGR